jgi:hypothetical protein
MRKSPAHALALAFLSLAATAAAAPEISSPWNGEENLQPLDPERGAEERSRVVIEQPVPIPLPLDETIFDWDFTMGDHGFEVHRCISAAEPVWEYGVTDFPHTEEPGAAWVTNLDGPYSDGAGHGLHSPIFLVTEKTMLVEVTHYFEIEPIHDGANVLIDGEILMPSGGYTTEEPPEGNAAAGCVGADPRWTGTLRGGWRIDYFDLHDYLGEKVNLAFNFGSDEFPEKGYHGWTLRRVRVGGPEGGLPSERGRHAAAADFEDPLPSRESSWGGIKNLFKDR